MMSKTLLILIVDDDPSIRRLSKRMLAPFEFAILEAATGKEALNHIENKETPVSVLLTDMNLPDMQGDELCEWARNLIPGLPVIFFSGAPLRESALIHLRSPNTYHLPKPFSKEAFENVFRQISWPKDPGSD
jgi:CheY-like chemotaxis protein